MIQANELRIGNFIKVISSTKTFDSFITQAKGYDIVRIEEKSFNHWNYEPVILDEEWLIKLGFKEISFTQDRNRDWYKMFEIDDTSEVVSLNYYTKTN